MFAIYSAPSLKDERTSQKMIQREEIPHITANYWVDSSNGYDYVT